MTKLLLRSRTGWALLAAFVFALLLPGCSTTPRDTPRDITLNRIQTRRVSESHNVLFAPGSAAIAPSERTTLDAFVEDRRAVVSGITLSSGTSPIAARRLANVSKALDAMGVVHTVAMPNPNFTADAVLVAATREIPVPPACPHWTLVGQYDPSNAPSTDLGCANATNLYLMVADPRDLVRGRDLGPADAQPGMRAVEAYRTGNQAVNPQQPSLGGGITSIGASSSGGGTSGGTSGQ
jgi:pilus assembly protein CpaD